MKHVLVIDDSPLALEAARRALEANGFAVRTLTEVADFEPRRDGVPDLVLVDVNMPQFFGDDVVEYIRTALEVKSPVLLFSNISETELDERARQCGANGYVCKQWGLSRMVTQVKFLLESLGT
jgi:DNA-binding response OmpR family regulator